MTGGAGLGSHLCERLLTDGCEVTALDDWEPEVGDEQGPSRTLDRSRSHPAAAPRMITSA